MSNFKPWEILGFDLELIVAATANGGIGSNNQLPWSIEGDLKRFREITTGGIVIMGRKTFDSIGKPLPNRTNIVVTSHTMELDHHRKEGECYVVNSASKAITMVRILKTDQKVFVIGGASLYEQLYPYVSKVHLTKVKDSAVTMEIDTYFRSIAQIDFDFESTVVEDSGYPTHHYLTYERLK